MPFLESREESDLSLSLQKPNNQNTDVPPHAPPGGHRGLGIRGERRRKSSGVGARGDGGAEGTLASRGLEKESRVGRQRGAEGAWLRGMFTLS